MLSSLRRPAAATLLFTLALLQAAAAQTQQRPPARKSPPVCEAGHALQLVRQQLSEAKIFPSGAKRVVVMARAAELLWPSDEAQARELFAEAFEVASAHYREHGQESTMRKAARPDSTMKGLTYLHPDPRLTVIRALARRDLAWAQRLVARTTEETRQRALGVGSKAERKGDPDEPAERLLSLARSLMSNELSLALSVARESLRHPASRFLSGFIYEAARADRAAADAFYADAVRAYAGGEVTELLQLSAYPFGLHLNLGLPYGNNAAGTPPSGFTPSPELQRQFVAALLRLAERRLQATAGQPPPENASQPSEAEMIYGALAALETLYGPADKTFTARAAPLRQMAGGMLSGTGLRRAEAGAQPKRPSEQPQDTSEKLERVLREAEGFEQPDRHDLHIVSGLWSSLRRESVERLEGVAEKLKDAEVRRQFRDGIYYEKALGAAKDGRPDEAARFAEKVGALEQRASLAWEVASAELKQSDSAPHGLALTESVHKSAQAAPESEEKAKSLLGVTHVYTRLDPTRVAPVLAEAVATINRVPDVDLSRAFITRAVEGHTYNFYAAHPAPGFTLETTLGQLAARDFETALGNALALDDKYLRALAVVTLASKCLEGVPEPEKPARPAKAAPKQQPAAKRVEAAPKPQSTPKQRP